MIYGKEEQDKEAKRRVKLCRDLARLYKPLSDVIRSFDGKVINCRLEKAMREATGHIISLDKRPRGYAITAFYKGEVITLAYIGAEILTDGKRINADIMIDSLRQHREGLLKRAADLERAAEQVEETRKRIEDLERTLKAVLDSVPYDVRDIYGLRARSIY